MGNFNMSDPNFDIDTLTDKMNDTQKEEFTKYMELYEKAMELEIKQQSLVLQGDFIVLRISEKIMQLFRGVLLVLCSDPDSFNAELVDGSSKSVNIL
jgi:translation initiation factor 2 beta subunit (eIF-2beta)/eIF-5